MTDDDVLEAAGVTSMEPPLDEPPSAALDANPDAAAAERANGSKTNNGDASNKKGSAAAADANGIDIMPVISEDASASPSGLPDPDPKLQESFTSAYDVEQAASNAVRESEKDAGVTASGHSGAAAESAGANSINGSVNGESRGHSVKWLDREVRSGRVHSMQLLGSTLLGSTALGPPAFRSDVYPRSYSRNGRRQPMTHMQAWGRVLRMVTTVGKGCAATALILTGYGTVVASYKRAATFAGCLVSFGGVKLALNSAHSLRKVDNSYVPELPAGTAARLWICALQFYITVTGVGACLPIASRVFEAYQKALQNAADGITRQHRAIGVTQLAVWNVDQVDRFFFGGVVAPLLGEQGVARLNKFMMAFDEFTGGHGERAAQETFSRLLWESIVALPIAYMKAAALVAVPAAVTTCASQRIQHHAIGAVMIIPVNHNRLEATFKRRAGRARFLNRFRRFTPFFAAMTQAAVVIGITKQVGLCGTRFSGKPRFKVPQFVAGPMRTLFGTTEIKSMPEVTRGESKMPALFRALMP